MTLFVEYHPDGQRLVLHECDIVDDEGRVLASFRQNGWFATEKFFQEFTAYTVDVESLRGDRL